MNEITTQERTKALFRYLKELSKMRQREITNVNEYKWKLYISDLNSDPDNIEIIYRDRIEEEDYNLDPVLVRIHRPELRACPKPDSVFADWLKPGWEDYEKDAEIELEKIQNGNRSVRFADSRARLDAYNNWAAERDDWQEEQKKLANTRDIFSGLYETMSDAKREEETMEVVVAAGFLLDRENSQINYPLISKRVSINYDPAENAISIEDLDVESELSTSLLQGISDLNLKVISEIEANLKANAYHPMDRNDTPEFLRVSIHKLSPNSRYSSTGIPTNWQISNRFLVYQNPVFLFRKRPDGTPRFLETAIENIDESGWVPQPIAETVSGGKISIEEKYHELTLEEQLAEVGGEDVKILLSKEANREQLEIAQRIEKYNAVLVQGPPGTGKTHTIANLIGHFLANGESVLVTSQTAKALKVLKEKITPEIRPLCVSVLDDKNTDMETSVDGITRHMAIETSYDLSKKAETLKRDRLKVINELGEVRKKIYQVINTESKNIVLNGEEYSPSEAASFIADNMNSLSYIPGKVKLYEPLPLTYNQLIDLYKSNQSLETEDEKELSFDLPVPEEIPSPEDFESLIIEQKRNSKRIDDIAKDKGWEIVPNTKLGTVFDIGYGEFAVPNNEISRYNEVSDYLKSFGDMEGWMKYAAADGVKGGKYAERWNTLINQINTTCEIREKTVGETFGKDISIKDPAELAKHEEAFKKISDLLYGKSKISKLDRMLNKGISEALDLVKIDGEEIKSSDDCNIIIDLIDLQKNRNKCAAYWKDLIERSGETAYYDLDPEEPEMIAKEWIPSIERNLRFYKDLVTEVDQKISSVGIHTTDVFVANRSDTGLQKTEKILAAIREIVPVIIEVCIASKHNADIAAEKTRTISTLRTGKRVGSSTCINLVNDIENDDSAGYSNDYKVLEKLYDKQYLQKTRLDSLNKLALIAPDWAEAIRTRDGIHGENSCPSNIEEAWKWKQLSGIVSEIISTPYDELQKESDKLSKRYREITGEYAEKLAWYHLLARTETDIDMKQALNGWRLTVRKIGKGTGKSAPKYKAEARKLMAKCQNAVPAWIMPMNKVIESLDPRNNQFDVLIVDEASQSDVTALGVVYLAKKVIIVGDDKQVSPLAIGTDQDKMNALESMYIKGVIPNSHLFGATTSLYDIAATTYQPLMLREHFRCVPDIIGFSNGLSYDYKIKPLRDAGSSKLLPAVVNYRVKDGERAGKRNVLEAKSIVALMKACTEQPEYKGKSFGVISLLGDEQAKYINALIYKYIGPAEIDKRKILCGNASHFQGDERDVMFLSVVDSNENEGPLPKQEFGAGEGLRKRYNVAASRAKDQLWVVDSLDVNSDLKPGDIRKRLIEYSINPNSSREVYDEIVAKSDSPFETAVVSELKDRGYNVVQQWRVGAYRIDLVVSCGNKHVAIECDGERYHSGEEKIREDMERQTILERSGWKFIRIRGSEYFRNRQKTIRRVIEELNENDIYPEKTDIIKPGESSELLDNIKARASEILEEFEEGKSSIEDIKGALGKTKTQEHKDNATESKPIIKDSTEGKNDNPPKPQESKPVVGGTVHNDRYGRGKIVTIEGNKVVVEFPSGRSIFGYPKAFENNELLVINVPVSAPSQGNHPRFVNPKTYTPKERRCENCYLFIAEECAGLHNAKECKDYKERI